MTLNYDPQVVGLKKKINRKIDSPYLPVENMKKLGQFLVVMQLTLILSLPVKISYEKGSCEAGLLLG